MTGVIVAALVIGVPALGFAMWPLVARPGRHRGLLPLPHDSRAELREQKRAVIRALRELDFEHGAGHLSDTDYAELRARYESEAAAVLGELDRLGPGREPAERPKAALPARRSAWRHPLVTGAAAVGLVAFGVTLGVGIMRYTSPDSSAGTPVPGSRPLAALPGGPDVTAGPPAGAGDASTPPRPISPEVMGRMLEAARASLFEGNYKAALAAYQAVLKRDPKNVDAMTHLGLIAAMAGHTDVGMQTIDRALGLDPNYGPALLYRGQILYEGGKDVAGAIRSWEKFVTVTPPGDDRERVTKMIAEAKKSAASK